MDIDAEIAQDNARDEMERLRMVNKSLLEAAKAVLRDDKEENEIRFSTLRALEDAVALAEKEAGE
jgi:hypothetical protein